MQPLVVLQRKSRVAAALAFQAAQVFRRDGLSASLRFSTGVARGILRERFGNAPKKSNPLDEEFGTDTAENAKLHSLDIGSPNYQYAVYYRATDLPVLDEILRRLEIRHEDYTFIDYGSGKGLVLLRAAAYPFRKVVGVEFARELHETAQRNVARYPAALRRAPVEPVHCDAVEYAPPEGNLALYLYEPFEAPVTRRMIARIDQFRHGRDVLVAYAWSKKQSLSSKPLWDAAPFLHSIAEGDGWTIYRCG